MVVSSGYEYYVNYFATGDSFPENCLQYQFKVRAKSWQEAKRKADELLVTRNLGLRREAERIGGMPTWS